MKAPELPALTGIRFFAASLVFLAHLWRLPGTAWYSSRYGLSNMGVSLFFVLSGFILTYNYARVLGDGVTFENYRRFIWDRLAKIYPLYLLTLLLAIPIEIAGQRDWSWSALALQLTLMQCILPVGQLSSTDHLNIPGWSISCEMLFYLLAPFLIWLGFSARRLTPTIVFGWLAACVLAVTTGIWATHVSAWSARFAPARVAEFLAGVITAVGFLKGRSPGNNVIQFCVGMGFILMCLSISFDNPVPCLSLGFLTAPGAALFIYGLAYGRGRVAQFLSHRWMLVLGTASFAFYLVHDLVIRTFKGALEHWQIEINNRLTATLLTVILFVAIQILSILLMKFFEIPAQKFLRGLVRKKNPA